MRNAAVFAVFVTLQDGDDIDKKVEKIDEKAPYMIQGGPVASLLPLRKA